ncbi:MAG: DUF120 domain-containing protein [Nitriliruptoraceae bacterium]|nr:DUF120 domain-containing protein [Nitriliruptoraceae bacterium]
MRIRGRVASGLQIASRVLPDHPDELKRASGYDAYPGTLNINLRRPIGLESVIPWQGPDDGRRRALIPAKLEGREVHINHWSGCPPDRIDLIAAVGLRELLSLADGDPVTVEVERAFVQRLPPKVWARWAVRRFQATSLPIRRSR